MKLPDAAGELARVSGEDKAAVIVPIGLDLHQFKLVYESLRHAAERCIKEEEEEEELKPEDELFRCDPCVEGFPLLRVWLGLVTPDASAPADTSLAVILRSVYSCWLPPTAHWA